MYLSKKEALMCALGVRDCFVQLKHHQEIQKGYARFSHDFETRQGPCCYLIGVPDYNNLGDLAIAEAEVAYLRQHFDGTVVEVPTGHLFDYMRCIQRFSNPATDLMCLQGGGNMGDVYPAYELERILAVDAISSLRTVLMPQTMAYNDWRSPLLSYSRKVYDRAGHRLSLFARESKSETLMNKYFTHNHVGSIPDIVLSLDPAEYCNVDRPSRSGIITLLRDDAEKAVDSRDTQFIVSAIESTGLPVLKSDTMVDYSGSISAVMRKKLLSDKLQEIASARLVVTDRLHGMIFAAITDTPCVVLSNNNHKVRGVYQWIRDLSYVKFVSDVSCIQSVIHELLRMPSWEEFPRKRILQYCEPLANAICSGNKD